MTLIARLQAAFAHYQAGQLTQAEAACRAILATAPRTGDALHLLGIIAHRQGDLGTAAQQVERAIAATPRQAEYHNTLGAIRRAAGDLPGAIAAFEKAVELAPRHAQAIANLGNALAQDRRYDEAAAQYRRALALAPRSPGVHNNLGNVLAASGDMQGAVASFRAALALKPDYPEALSNLGWALVRTERVEDAIDAYRQALAIDPDHLPAIANIGGALMVAGAYQEAIAYYQRTLERRGDVVQFHFNVVALQNYAEDASATGIRQLAERYGASLPAAPVRQFDNDRDPGRRLRVGLVSADLHAHSVTRFLLPLLENFDRDRLEFIAFSMDSLSDDVTQHLRRIMPDWHDLRGVASDAAAARVIAARTDILIDLSGFTEGARLDVFARRAAPVQASWLGYSGTTGVREMDYIIADARVAPPGSEAEFSEAVCRLPGAYLCFGRPDVSPVRPLPALRNGYVTFGSFNNLGKVNDGTLSVWIDLLQAVPDSRLLVKSARGGVRGKLAQLHDRLVAGGIAPERLRFVDRIPDRDDHMALYGEVDIGLDPFPYNGTTTTCEAMWMGVPVLTRKGRSFVSRVGETLMTSVGLADWVAEDPADYVARGRALAADLPALAELRAGLRQRAEASPLGDAPRFARDFEVALRSMWHAWCEDQP